MESVLQFLDGDIVEVIHYLLQQLLSKKFYWYSYSPC
jgi:hypothetical protein